MHFPSSPWGTKRWKPCFLSGLVRSVTSGWAQLAWAYVHTGAQVAWSHLPQPADASIYGPGADLRPAAALTDSSTPPWGVCPA